MPPQPIIIALFPGFQSLDVTGPYEVFSGANEYLAAQGQPARYRLSLVGRGVGRTYRSASGLQLLCDKSFSELRGELDILLVPGGDGARRHGDDPGLVPAIAQLAGRARRVVSVCTGAFLLAEAGLLDGRRATTHWAWCERLALDYPTVRIESDPIYVRDGHVYTSAGVTAGIDLALALVEEDLGREAALTIARHLVLFLRRPGNQRQFSVQLRAQTAERDALREVQAHIAEHLHLDLSVEALAERAAMSPRNFARCFKREVGTTPARYVAKQRLEAARRLLEESNEPIERIALRSGFGTPETLRQAFLRQLGLGPREYRRRFSAAPVHPTGDDHAAFHPDL